MIKSMLNDLRANYDSVCYLMKYFHRVKGGTHYQIIQVLLTVIDAVLPVAYMIFPGMIINELAQDCNLNKILIYVALLLILPLLNHIKELTLRVKANQLYRRLRRAFQDELQSYVADMEYASLENPEIAVQLNRIGMHAPNAPLEMFGYLLRLGGALVSALAISSIIVYLSPIIIIILLVIIFIDAWVTKRINDARHRYQLEYSKLDNEYWCEFYNLTDYNNGKEMRLFRTKDFFINRYTSIGKKQDSLTDKQEKYAAKWNSIHAVTSVLQQGVLYSIALYRVIFSNMQIGSMTIFLSAAGSFSNAIRSIFDAYMQISAYTPNVEEMKSFRSQPTVTEASGKKIPVFNENSVIEFVDVSFCYPGSEQYALRHLNLKVNCRQKLCIVGENGSGKTTFIKLLTRLYQPSEGKILLDGVDISEFDIVAYQKLFSPVFQDYCEYSLPLALNIALEEDYHKEKLEGAIDKAGIDTLVEKLPKGVDTYVGKNIDSSGFEPSGGEGQKIAISRALYHDSPIFLLDEPTAALDPFAEYEIYSTFSNIINDHTAIMITHRMSAVKLCDNIAVFDGGSIAEYGTHAELYAKGGIYTEMFDRQAEFYRDSNSDQSQSG